RRARRRWHPTAGASCVSQASGPFPKSWRFARLYVQFIQQRLSFFQIGSVEALGEPAADVGEHRARFVASPLLYEQVCKADSRAQLPPLGLLTTGDFERLVKAVLRVVVRLRLSVSALFVQQFSFEAVELCVEPAVAVLFENN